MNSFSSPKHIFAALATEKAFLISLLAVSVAINLLLTKEVVQQRNLVQLLSSNRKLTVGETAPTLSAHDKNGQEVSINLSGRRFPTVLYLHSVTCHWCEQNNENLRHLALQSPGKYQLITLLMEPAAKAPNFISYPNTESLFDSSVESRIIFDLSATPATILFSAEGKVEKIWKGAYGSERKIDIEKTLGIQVPGLSEAVFKQP